jgi:hypothetical protein
MEKNGEYQKKRAVHKYHIYQMKFFERIKKQELDRYHTFAKGKKRVPNNMRAV